MQEIIQTIDLSKILKDCSNEWVALSEDEKRVVSSGKTPREAHDRATKKGEGRPVLLRAPKNFGTYILTIGK